MFWHLGETCVGLASVIIIGILDVFNFLAPCGDLSWSGLSDYN